MAAKKDPKKKARKIMPAKSGRGPTKGPERCGDRYGIDEPDCVCTKESGHVEDGHPFHYSKPFRKRWKD